MVSSRYIVAGLLGKTERPVDLTWSKLVGFGCLCPITMSLPMTMSTRTQDYTITPVFSKDQTISALEKNGPSLNG